VPYFKLIKNYRGLTSVLVFGLTVIVGGLVVLGTQIVAEVESMEDKTRAFYDHPFRVNAAARDASLMISRMRSHALESLSSQIIVKHDKHLSAQMDDHKKQLTDNLHIIESYFLGDMSQVQEAKVIADDWHKKREAFYALIENGKRNEAGDFMKFEVAPLYASLNRRLDYVREFSSFKAESMVVDSEGAAHRSIERFKLLIILMQVFTLVIGVAMLLIILKLVRQRDNQIALQHERVARMANYDELTQLPNRALFSDRLNQSLLVAKRRRSRFSLMFMDLDGFKKVNDNLGHHSGDLLLKQVAERLLGCFRESDTVGRMGGDEFTVLLNDTAGRAELATMAAKVVHVISSPFYLEGSEVHIGVSIGIASGSEITPNISELLNNADLAMYESKKQGKNRYTFYGDITQVNEQEWIRFEESHHVGINDIDVQHHGLARILSRLNSMILQGKEKSEILAVFDELFAATVKHFETEERYMSHYGYPAQSAHYSEHARLVRVAIEIREELSRADTKLDLQAIRDWLMFHIESADRHLAQYLLQHGVS
jgi:diguanylate cyclase (GGDEF)-like protein/hemerythrin-like metal-binding protein